MKTPIVIMIAAATFAGGCTHHTVEIKPIKIEPIYARIDVYVKVDKELDNFFDFEEDIKPKLDDDQPGGAETPAGAGN